MEQANRVRHFMNYQTQIQMPEYGPELDRLLFYVSLYGSAFKKTYWDISLQRPRTEYIKAQDFYIDYFASDLETAERFTHRYSMSMNEIKKFQMAGTFRDVEVDESSISESDAEDASNEVLGITKPFGDTERVEILEMHVNLDLPGFEDPNGLKLPYIVHMTDDGVVLAIRRNWDEDDVKKRKEIIFYSLLHDSWFRFLWLWLHSLNWRFNKNSNFINETIDRCWYVCKFTWWF